MIDSDIDAIIEKTKKWITDVVIGCNFCPFAAKEVKRDSIHYEVLTNANTKNALAAIMRLLYQLDDNNAIETSLLIMPGSFLQFDEYLKLLKQAEKLLAKENYKGIYQVASFHPHYLFAESTDSDPSNYTNRSPFPMLHFLREESVTKAIDSYPDIDKVPKRNIAFTKEKGLAYMQKLSGQQ
ncbi:MAG: DUF1415 domain-containing protein [Chitinophagaceae bacterium]